MRRATEPFFPSVAWLRGEKSPAALRVHGRGVDFLQTIRAAHPGHRVGQFKANLKLINRSQPLAILGFRRFAPSAFVVSAPGCAGGFLLNCPPVVLAR
jgi:hypothetical protein